MTQHSSSLIGLMLFTQVMGSPVQQLSSSQVGGVGGRADIFRTVSVEDVYSLL